MLRVVRQNAGMSQQHVAHLLGHKETVSISQWEHEQVMPSGANLVKLCILYNKPVHELYPEYYERTEQEILYR
jgi:DNA-binding transcriptional regulator YiaG